MAEDRKCPIRKRIFELADPNVPNEERSIGLLRLSTALLDEKRNLEIDLWEEKNNLANITNSSKAIERELAVQVDKEVDPSTSKKIFTNAEARSAEVSKRIETNENYANLQEDRFKISRKIGIELEPEIGFRTDLVKVIRAFFMYESKD